MSITLADIEEAHLAIAPFVLRTRTLPAPILSSLTGAEVYLKYENMQVTSSFKERGALWKLLSLSRAQRDRGVVTMSAGNHAQAVARHASRLCIPATVVMPATTPFVKIKATEDFGARVILEGQSIADAQQRAESLVRERDLTMVHPYDDQRVIAGQGTLALEMIEDVPDIEILIIPVGGGGLIAGCSVAVHAKRTNMEIIGVQSCLYPSMWNAINHGQKPVGGLTLAEGIAVRNVGRLTEPICRQLVSRIVLVDDTDLERAIYSFLTLQKTMVEGAGAAGLAAMLAAPSLFRGRRVGLILSGGNIDPRVLATITVRGLEREARIVTFNLTTNQERNALVEISKRVEALHGHIMEVHHSRLFLDAPSRGTSIQLTIETADEGHIAQIERVLRAEGYQIRRL